MTTTRLVLHPRIGDPSALRVWLGVIDHDAELTEANLSWTLDGSVAAAQPVRTLARTFDYDGLDFRGTITGVFDLPCDAATHSVQVTVTAAGTSAVSDPLRTAPRAAQIPTDGSAFNVLLTSCFYQPEDKNGRVGFAVDHLPASLKPHLTLLMGDQVYLDNPPTEAYPGGAIGATRRLEQKYLANWSVEPGRPSGFAHVLDSAPAASVPDDHEYWNNYPMHPIFPAELLTESGRENWATSAVRLFEAFQQNESDVFDRTFDVAPLSFYLMDNRTFRSSDLDHSLEKRNDQTIGLNRYRDWIAHLDANPTLIPILVTGPSVFQTPRTAAWWKFWKGPKSGASDANLSNFGDYPAILGGLRHLAGQGRPVLSWTGDVHYPRVLGARAGLSGGVIHEVISSPSSLVPFLWKDDPNTVSWPKGMRMSLAGGEFAIERFFPTEADDQSPGNHIAIASFRQVGFGVELGLTYVVLDGDESFRILPPVVIPLRRLSA